MTDSRTVADVHRMHPPRTCPPTLVVPHEIEGRSPDAHRPAAPNAVTLAAAAAAVVAWWATGAAAAVPVALLGGLAFAASLWDLRTGRIPNGLIVLGLVVEAFAWVFVSLVDNRSMGPLLGDMAAGLALSGAPAMFLVWLVAPWAVGGGDWKLLGVLGIALGFVAPLGATVIAMGAFVGGSAVAVTARRRTIILAPPLTLGYVAAILAVVAAPALFGSSYM